MNRLGAWLGRAAGGIGIAVCAALIATFLDAYWDDLGFSTFLGLGQILAVGLVIGLLLITRRFPIPSIIGGALALGYVIFGLVFLRPMNRINPMPIRIPITGTSLFQWWGFGNFAFSQAYSPLVTMVITILLVGGVLSLTRRLRPTNLPEMETGFLSDQQ